MSMSGSYYESFACFDFSTYEGYSNFNDSQMQLIELNKTLWDYVRHRAINEYYRGKSGGIAGGGTECSRNDTEWFYIPDCSRAGKGGDINYSKSCKIYAYNGSYITTKDSKEMSKSERIDSQALIYAQVGFNVKKIRDLLTVKKVVSRTADSLISEWTQYNNTTFRDINYSTFTSYLEYDNGSGYGLGIGSGAGGYQEADGNGTFTQITD